MRIDQFMAKPAGQRHLYEIHTDAQGELVTDVIISDQITELALHRNGG